MHQSKFAVAFLHYIKDLFYNIQTYVSFLALIRSSTAEVKPASCGRDHCPAAEPYKLNEEVNA